MRRLLAHGASCETGEWALIKGYRHSQGDVNVFLVNTTNWVTFSDVSVVRLSAPRFFYECPPLGFPGVSDVDTRCQGLTRALDRNQHPNPSGHQKIARLFARWLAEWGLEPAKTWATAVH
jgi:hypothetical protein